MRSPLHPNSILVLKEIDAGLKAYVCTVSGGIWIPLQNYLDWQAYQPKSTNPGMHPHVPKLVDDSKQRALICPESGRLMLRYRVGYGLPFHLDRSPATGGVWLDAGEWEALKVTGLHVQLHLIFTASYQRAVRSEQYDQTMDEVFRNRIGTESFDRVLEFKRWAATHPKCHEICCYLLNAFNKEEEPAT